MWNAISLVQDSISYDDNHGHLHKIIIILGILRKAQNCFKFNFHNTLQTKLQCFFNWRFISELRFNDED